MTSESQKRANKKWKHSHRDKVNLYQREARKKNPERYKEYQIRYWKKKLDSLNESEVK